ncbi:hypothetical protein [Moorena producens]|uniref:hypothetical protein n=1 Tax=Moorena producens TaxID=1155739 RepID=UPI001874F9EE|nr:hypothetical protein [Moorena producens]
MAVEESVEQYRQWIHELLLERANRKPTFPEIETQAVLDTERDHLSSAWRLPLSAKLNGEQDSPPCSLCMTSQ